MSADSATAQADRSGQQAFALAMLGLVFLGLMGFLARIAWDPQSVDLTEFTKNLSTVVAALFGSVINPVGGRKPEPGAKGVARAWYVWPLLTLGGLVALVAIGVAAWQHTYHPNCMAALTTGIAAYAGLFIDTSKISHVPSSSTTPATPAPAPATPAAAAPAPADGGDGQP